MSDEMDEIWELYADDGSQALDAMEAALEALMAGGDDPDRHVAALFRAVHTFKGNSRVLGLSVVESRAHLSEDLIGLVRDAGVPLTSEILDCLMEAGDHLRRMLDETAQTRADVDPTPSEGLAERLRALIARLGDGEEDGADDTEEPTADPEAAEPEREAEAEPEPEPEPESAPDAEAAVVAEDDADPEPAAQPDEGADGEEDEEPDEEPAQTGRLKLDPQFEAIFLDMVDSTLADLDALRGGDAGQMDQARIKADGLSYAAGQLGLTVWTATLAPAAAEGFDASALDVMIERLKGLRQVQFGGGGDAGFAEDDDPFAAFERDAEDTGDADPEAVAPDAVPEAMPASPPAATAATPAAAPATASETDRAIEALGPLLRRVADLGLAIEGQGKIDRAALRALAGDIEKTAAALGYVRVAQAGLGFADIASASEYRMAQIRFYEELVVVERSLPAETLDRLGLRPSALLASWAADNAFEILQRLRDGLENDTRGRGASWFPDFELLMRQAFHACNHFQVDTAGQLTMSLVDLFSRVRLEGKAPDVILIQIALGFIDTMELVFDTLNQGDIPDIARIEQLFEEAATVSFLASGVVTARVIEERLGLGPEFHRVLSPESVRAAQSAIEAGLKFFVIRADLNNDDKMAEAFLHWLSAGKIRMITNVTVFQGDITLFDFLVAAPLAEDTVVEAMVGMDPAGRNLQLLQTLEAKPEDGQMPGAAGDATGQPSDALSMGLDTMRFIETIGEMSAGQSMIGTMLDELAAVDLVRDLDFAVRQAGMPRPDPRLMGLLRDHFEAHQARLRQIGEAQSQLNNQLAELQEQSVALRSRPADVLLKPLQTFFSTQTRAAGLNARLSVAGGEVMIDQSMIDQLRGILRQLLTLRLGADPAPRKIHVSVSRQEDHIRFELSDDGGAEAGELEIAAIARDLKADRATLRRVVRPEGGLRLHLSMPLHMIALEGMVVRVGAIHYVLPIEAIQRIHQGSAQMCISAARGRRMVRLGEDELVPIRPLARSADSAGGGQAAGHGTGEGQEGLYVIVHSDEDTRLAIPVDELLGQQLVLLRPLQGVLGHLRDVSGVAILSGGDVGVVVSVSRLAEAA